ncbi:MAG: hypothetical protein IJD48_02870, partial [Clostridia bacterium]|nr:hypothetical protein [Clostridia bacterium]
VQQNKLPNQNQQISQNVVQNNAVNKNNLPQNVQQPQAPQVQPQAPQVQPQAPQVQPQAPQVQPQAPQVQPQAPQVQPQAPQVQPQAPQMQPQAPQVQPQAPQVQKPNIPQQNISLERPMPQQPIVPQQNVAENKNPISQIQENINNNLNNIKENIQNNVLNNADKLIQNTKQNIKQQSLLNPHNHLHNIAKNSVRNGIILNQQVVNDIQNQEQMQANLPKTQGMTAEQLAQFKQSLASQLNANVNLTNVSALLQQNSKIAMNKMVSMMTMATAQGMTDVQPLQDTMNVINASVAATSQNDATQTLKNLRLLYLPWLPLQEGVGFDLEIEQDETLPESDTFIKILITMVNYGNLQATVSLISGNSVDIAIICSEKFPKKELFRRLHKDGSQHSMQTVIDIKEQKPQEKLDAINPKAKVNLSNVNQVNPYLLLMSHAIIRHTIELDATISIGEQPIDDD